jgi:hypothetical protein
MRKTIILFSILLFLFGCKSFFKDTNTGNLRIINSSHKVIEFVWIAPEGEFFPTAKSVSINNNETYEVQGLESGKYDIAIDFKNEYNSFNSKKDKSLCLEIEKGISTVWIVNPDGEIIR